MDVYDLILESFLPLFYKGKYTEAIEILHQAWDGITDKNTQITEQIYIQSELGRCYLELIKRSKGASEAEIFVKQASENFLAAYEQLSQLNDEVEKKEWEKTLRQGLRDIDYLMKIGIPISSRKNKKYTNHFFTAKLHSRRTLLQPYWQFSLFCQ